jgi:hypothetical protein
VPLRQWCASTARARIRLPVGEHEAGQLEGGRVLAFGQPEGPALGCGLPSAAQALDDDRPDVERGRMQR